MSSRHSKFKDLIHLLSVVKTNQLFGDQVFRECRGLILHESTDFPFWIPVCIPHSKILHYLDPKIPFRPTEEKWESLEVSSFVEGIPVCMYWWGNEWNLSSLWEPNDPKVILSWKSESQREKFSEKFWKVWNNLGYQFPNEKEM